MRFTFLLALLGALTLSSAQIVKKADEMGEGMMKMAQMIDNGVKFAQEQYNRFFSSFNLNTPVAAASAKVAGQTVYPLTISSVDTFFAPQTLPQEYVVYFTGGNRTCLGQCERVDAAFNASAAASSVNPSAPHFAYVNCEDNGLFCTTWFASPPELWHIQRPAAGAAKDAEQTDIYTMRLNTTHTTKMDVDNFYGKDKGYATRGKKHDTISHPWDGFMTLVGLNKPLGYVLFVLQKVPNWAMMLGVTMISRTFMSSRMGTQPGGPARAAPAAAAPKN